MRSLRRPMPALGRAAFAGTFALLAACSSAKDGNPPPGDVTCGSVVNGGGDAPSLTHALAGAAAGSCVVLVSQTYTGNFTVPAGVTLVSAEGSRAKFVGTDPNAPAIELAGGPASGIAHLDVTSSAAVGIAVRGGAAVLSDVKVSGAASAGVAALCSDASCRDGAHVLDLEDVDLTANDTGLWSNGEDVKMTNGSASKNASQSLTGGNGIVVFGGAKLVLSGTKVENNDQVGILLDGNTGSTTGDFDSVSVSTNGARGIWAQHLNGTIDTPALKIGGSSTSFSGNKLVGLGAVDTHGIIFVGGKIESTVAAPISTTIGDTEQVGDGFGIFGDSADIKLDTVQVSQNARAAGLIDNPKGVIIFVGGTVDPGGSGLKIVVQNKDASVAAPDIDGSLLSTPTTALGFSAPKIATGSILK